MSDPAILAIVATAGSLLTLIVDRVLTWARNRRKDDAEVGLTIDQRWERYTDQLEDRLATLESRVTELETDLNKERERAKGLEAEVDRYRSIARSLLRHVLRLREALGKTDVEMPAIPQDIEDALTGIDLP